jgi:hypothetical protein
MAESDSVKSKTELRYDRWSAGQSVLVLSPIWGPRPVFCYSQTVKGLLMWGGLSDERTGLSLITAAGPRRRTYSRVQVPPGLMTIFYCLRFETRHCKDRRENNNSNRFFIVTGRCLAMPCLLIEPSPRNRQCLSEHVTLLPP